MCWKCSTARWTAAATPVSLLQLATAQVVYLVDMLVLAAEDSAALQAFWPSLLVLACRVEAARFHFQAFLHLWRRNDRALPDMWNVRKDAPGLGKFGRDAPLRPELCGYSEFRHACTQNPSALARYVWLSHHG